MREISLKVMDRLYLADSLYEIRAAFDFRTRIRARWDTIKPRLIKEEIQEI